MKMKVKTMKTKYATSLVVAAAVLAGCSKVEPAPAATPAPPATAAKAAHTTAAVADGEFGVKECDDYVRKYLACIDTKVPEATRAMVRQSFDQTRAGWKQAAATPEGKAGLASACAQMTATSRTAMQAYGCSF